VTEFVPIVLSGLSLGVVTAVSPCPLASNVAAVAWLAKHAASRRRAVLGAIVYTLGRTLAYAAVALLLWAGAVGAPALSSWLQQWLPPLLGPLLVLTAMVLLELLPLSFSTSASPATAQRLAAAGWLGELALGFLFALTFCPVSAALFFGSLLPMALASPSGGPAVIAYGIGTALPVGVFAIGVALSAGFVAGLGPGLARWQPRLRVGTGAVLLAVGLFLIGRDTLLLF
jgi:cytochrome c biogenesis protein CcdA